MVFYSNLLENSLGLRLSEAGHTCKDWSRFGKQAGAVGKSAKYFWLWCAERLAVLEDLCICECSEDFDPILFEFALASEYDMHSLILNATMFGDCVLRKRRFTVCPTCLSLAVLAISAHCRGRRAFLYTVAHMVVAFCLCKSDLQPARARLGADTPQDLGCHRRHHDRSHRRNVWACSRFKFGLQLLCGRARE